MDVLREIDNFTDFHQLASFLLPILRDKLKSNKAFMLVVEGEHFYDPFKKNSIPIDENTPMGWCSIYGDTLILEKDKLKEEPYGKNLENLLIFPIKAYGKTVALLILSDKKGGFSDKDISTLKEMEEEISIAIRWVQNKKNLTSLTQKCGEFMIKATDQMTSEGEGHCIRVATISSEIAQRLDVSDISRKRLWTASMLHDIGKVLMAGRDMWEIERFHPTLGGDFLRHIPLWKDVAYMVETSHERYDGSGYPKGIKGDDLPLENWILTLAEDIEEFNFENSSKLFEDMIFSFYSQRAESHHPECIEALTSLVNDSTLEKILRDIT